MCNSSHSVFQSYVPPFSIRFYPFFFKSHQQRHILTKPLGGSEQVVLHTHLDDGSLSPIKMVVWSHTGALLDLGASLNQLTSNNSKNLKNDSRDLRRKIRATEEIKAPSRICIEVWKVVEFEVPFGAWSKALQKWTLLLPHLGNFDN